MSGSIVNLNKARKAKTKAQAAQTAEENRVKHGRTKAEKLALKAQKALDKAKLDGAKRDD